MKKIFLGLLLFLIILLTPGCGVFDSWKAKPSVTINYHIQEDLTKSGESIQKSSELLDTASNTIEESAVEIKRESQDIMLMIEDETVDPMLENIKDKSNVILNSVDDLRKAKNELAIAYDKVKIAEEKSDEISDNSKQLKKERDEAVKEKEKLEDDIKSNITKMLKLIIGGSIIGIGVCGALAAFGSFKGGITGASGCAITLVLAIVVGQHIALIAWVGVIVLFFCIGLIIYHIYIDRKAIKEVVTSTEKIKEEIPNDLKDKLFGTKGEIRPLQSPSTEIIVKEEKNKLKKLLTA